MDIKALQKNWNEFGKSDPLWAVLTAPDKAGGVWNVEEFFKTGEEEIARLMERVRSLNGVGVCHKALDFGCGVGRLTQALAGHCDEVVGVYIAPSMILQAEKFKRRNNCRYRCNAEPDLRMFKDNELDLIYTRLVLQHIKPVYSRMYIAEFMRILKPGSMLVFQLPSGKKRRKGGLAGLCRALIPEPLIDWLFHARIRFKARLGGKPVMEMYYIGKNDVVNLCRENGGEVLDIQDESPVGSVWIGTTYFVRKNQAPAH